MSQLCQILFSIFRVTPVLVQTITRAGRGLRRRSLGDFIRTLLPVAAILKLFIFHLRILWFLEAILSGRCDDIWSDS